MAPTTDVIQGTLDLLILKSLSLEPMHGFGVTQRIEQISDGVFKVNPGSLLLAFQRLERGGLVDGEWRATENNRRARYYRLTRAGRLSEAVAQAIPAALKKNAAIAPMPDEKSLLSLL